MYGKSPEPVTYVELDWDEYMSYLYLPVKFPGPDGEVRLPPNLRFIEPLLNYVRRKEETHDRYDEWLYHYVYVTAKRGYATPENPLNRPGWHTDGFGTDDINYIWSDVYPTRFAVQEFTDISTDHIRSMQQFEEQVDTRTVLTGTPNTLYRLTPYVVHATPVIPPPGCIRSFVKVSISPHRYNLKGNSHNYLFDYDWKMVDRDELRNDPARYGRDYA